MQKSTHTSGYARLREELRQARTEAGLSQHQLADLLRVPRTWVTKVESGERRIDVIEFAWFLAACGGNPVETFARISRVGGTRRSSKGERR